jgi:uncharacterized protein YaaW (UPF0174 family)
MAVAETTKQTIDAISIFTVVGTLSDLLPPIAAAITIVWTCIRIYETDTVQGLLGKRRDDDG